MPATESPSYALEKYPAFGKGIIAKDVNGEITHYYSVRVFTTKAYTSAERVLEEVILGGGFVKGYWVEGIPRNVTNG